MPDRYRHMARLWVAVVVVVFLALVGLRETALLRAKVLGDTPEFFRRVDAVELMEALCLMNKGLRCPDPYDLPRYHAMTEGRLP